MSTRSQIDPVILNEPKEPVTKIVLRGTPILFLLRRTAFARGDQGIPVDLIFFGFIGISQGWKVAISS